jgi:DNA transformation protein
MNEYVEHLQEVFAAFGPIVVRRMFSGYGVYRQGLMFALAADEVLYLKADTESASYFTARGLEPFVYQRRGQGVALSYYQAPDEVMDDREQAALWAHRAFEAALRSQAAQLKVPARLRAGRSSG